MTNAAGAATSPIARPITRSCRMTAPPLKRVLMADGLSGRDRLVNQYVSPTWADFRFDPCIFLERLTLSPRRSVGVGHAESLLTISVLNDILALVGKEA